MNHLINKIIKLKKNNFKKTVQFEMIEPLLLKICKSYLPIIFSFHASILEVYPLIETPKLHQYTIVYKKQKKIKFYPKIAKKRKKINEKKKLTTKSRIETKIKPWIEGWYSFVCRFYIPTLFFFPI